MPPSLAKSTCGPGKCDHALEREIKRVADGPERAERRAAPVREQVTERSLIDASMAREVATCPTSKDPGSVDRGHIDGPVQRTVVSHR